MDFFKFFGVTNPTDAGTGLLAVVALAYAVGDYVSNRTKAVFSMVFVTGAVFLSAFWILEYVFGSPEIKNIFKSTALDPFYGFAMPFILVHMGSLMKVRNLLNEWKTVIIALLGIVGMSIGLYLAAGPIIGHIMSLAAAGPISGGIVATYIIRETLEAKGLVELSVFAALLLVIQNFVGLPVASWCLKKEGRRLLQEMHSGSAPGRKEVAKIDPDVPAWRLFPATPKELQTPFILIFKVFLVGYVAVWFGQFTGGVIHKLILALIFGIIFYESGFLEHDIFTKAKAEGYAMFFCLIPVWTGLTAATPGMVIDLFFPIVLCFGMALGSLAVTSWVIGKIVNYSWALAMAISITCFFGFHANYILSNEVSAAIAADEEEKKHILNEILPKMLIGGFTTVTIGSVILAGYLASLIAAQ